MATKFYCDICNQETPAHLMTAAFKIIEFDLSGKSGNQQQIKITEMCDSCGKKVKFKIVELQKEK